MKFSILDGKTEFTILDGIWTKNGQMTNRSLVKNPKVVRYLMLPYHHLILLSLLIAACGDPPLPPPLSTSPDTTKRFASSLPCSRPTCRNMLVAQQKLSEDIKSTLIYELKVLHFFT